MAQSGIMLSTAVKGLAFITFVLLAICLAGCLGSSGASGSVPVATPVPAASLAAPAGFAFNGSPYPLVYEYRAASPDEIKGLLASFVGGANASLPAAAALSLAVDVSGLRGMDVAFYMQDSPEAGLLKAALNNTSYLWDMPDMSQFGPASYYDPSTGDLYGYNSTGEPSWLGPWLNYEDNGTMTSDYGQLGLDPSLFNDTYSLSGDPLGSEFGLGALGTPDEFRYAAAIVMQFSNPLGAELGCGALQESFPSAVDEGRAPIGDGAEKYYLAEAGMHIIICRCGSSAVLIMASADGLDESLAKAVANSLKA